MSSRQRLYLLITFVAYALVVLLSVGAVMRESDQAALLDGALILAQDGAVFERGFYNYERQFGSYWLLAAVFKLAGLAGEVVSAARLVFVGNLSAAWVFLIGLGAFVFRQRKVTLPTELVKWSALLSPVVLFSSPLLASNLYSAGALLLLISLLSVPSSRATTVLAGFASFAAVALRADAALVMPLLAFLGSYKERFSSLFADRRLWVVGFSAVVAILVGTLVSSRSSASYGAFFEPAVAVTYLAFGLCGALLVLLVAASFLPILAVKKRELLPFLIAVALLIPLFFYARILFTPRHLFTSAIAVLAFASFSTSREYLQAFFEVKAGKVAFALLALVTFAPFVIGVRLSSLKSGKLVFTEPTLYPTADGLWPMGCYAQFLTRLGNADQISLDHNQRVWSAWLGFKGLPPRDSTVAIQSSGLTTYGNLRLNSLGQRDRIDSQSEVVLTDGRSLVSRAVKRTEGVLRESLAPRRRGQVFRSEEGAIYLFDETGPELRDAATLASQLLGEGRGGNDFIVGTMSDDWSRFPDLGPFRWIAFQRDLEGGIEIIDEKIAANRPDFSLETTDVVARSALPVFFRKRALLD